MTLTDSTVRATRLANEVAASSSSKAKPAWSRRLSQPTLRSPRAVSGATSSMAASPWTLLLRHRQYARRLRRHAGLLRRSPDDGELWSPDSSYPRVDGGSGPLSRAPSWAARDARSHSRAAGGVHETVVDGDVLCGRLGRDQVLTNGGRIFWGRGVVTFVTRVHGGTFLGGRDADIISGPLVDGTYIGGTGNDKLGGLHGGTFLKGALAETSSGLDGGTYKGGGGNYPARNLEEGTFYGGHATRPWSTPPEAASSSKDRVMT